MNVFFHMFPSWKKQIDLFPECFYLEPTQSTQQWWCNGYWVLHQQKGSHLHDQNPLKMPKTPVVKLDAVHSWVHTKHIYNIIDIISYHIISYHIISYHIISYHIISYLTQSILYHDIMYIKELDSLIYYSVTSVSQFFYDHHTIQRNHHLRLPNFLSSAPSVSSKTPNIRRFSWLKSSNQMAKWLISQPKMWVLIKKSRFHQAHETI